VFRSVSTHAFPASLARRARHTLRLLAAVVALLVLAACAPRTTPSSAGTPAPEERPYIIVVSFDGFRHDYLDRVRAPNFSRIAKSGVRARALIPGFPSKTFPNHYSIATGLYPGHHGIVNTRFYDPARGAWYSVPDTTTTRDGSWYGGEPIWVTAERQGVRSATYFWPGSEAAIRGARPSRYKLYDEKVPDSTRVDSVAQWLRLPAEQRPHLVLLYSNVVDAAGHTYGPASVQVDSAIAAADRTLGRLLDSLDVLPIRGRVNVVLVSDHGMAPLEPQGAIYIDDLISLDSVRSHLAEVSSLWFGGDTVRLEASYTALRRGLRHARVYRRNELPARWHVDGNPRIGDLVIVPDQGYRAKLRSAGTKPLSGGDHGYPPELPDMHGIFLAAGPQVKPAGVIPALENVNVYPFLAALLRIEPATKIDGRLAVLAPVLR
jgi:predicted AlkP superfamily pyrophosphatase or phosphodiesterase